MSIDAKPSKSVTPLWIVATFVTLTEAVLGVAVTQVAGGVQIALTAFVIVFPLLVAWAFFMILWHKPWVFYSPSEYADVNPKDFMSALRDTPGLEKQVALAKSLDKDPLDLEARFELIDSMADEGQCQWIILMAETGKQIPQWSHGIYEFRSGAGGSGAFMGFGKNSIEGTGLLTRAGGGRYITLTEQGKQFAQWLVQKGRKSDYFWSEYGTWGEPAPDGFAEKSIKQMKEQQEKKNLPTSRST